MDFILSKMKGKEVAFCFHSTHGESPYWGEISWGVEPFLSMTAYGDQITLQEGKKLSTFKKDPLWTLRELLDRYSVAGMEGRAVGFLSYELWSTLGLGIKSQRDHRGFPSLFFAFYEKIWNSPSSSFISGRGSSPFFPSYLKSFSSLSHQEYIHGVGKIQNYIAAGDIYQANLTQRFTIPCSVSLSQAFLTLCEQHPMPYGAYLRCGDLEILSNSPECFLKYDPKTRILETWPMKGTCPRGLTSSEDFQLREDLLSSSKDRAENLMIVDLERNDVGRVCETGSVEVPKLCELRSFGTVHHLVSQVRGVVRGDCDRIDILRACFPGGSVTGAPKLRALQILEELEPSPREVYTGAIGYFGFDGSMHFNVAIRTAWRMGSQLCYAAGGGIVADSDPEKEYEESLLKASILQLILKDSVRVEGRE